MPSIEPDLQILHKNVQALASSGCAVDALKHWRHLAGLDRLEDLDDSLEMCFLYI
jgi:biotin operon repressor